mmetsp:Transcript_2569/g.5845  ORF Transcript_2569/g.5845 Transcript_2569/m.5845 type:complete len:90 (+) Transcript_2569:46-315(+)
MNKPSRLNKQTKCSPETTQKTCDIAQLETMADEDEVYTQSGEVPAKYKKRYKIAMVSGERPRDAKPRLKTQSTDFIGRKYVIVSTNYSY